MPFQLDMTRAEKAAEFVLTSEQMADLSHSEVRAGKATASANGVVENGHARSSKLLNKGKGSKKAGKPGLSAKAKTQKKAATASASAEERNEANSLTQPSASSLSSSGESLGSHASMPQNKNVGTHIATEASVAALDALSDEAASSDELEGFARTGSAVRKAQGISEQAGRVRNAFQRGKRLELARKAVHVGDSATATGSVTTKAISTSSTASGASASSGGLAAAVGGFLAPLLIILGAILSVVILVAVIDGGEDEYIAELSENENIVAALLKDHGFDELHIAAIMGNWSRESDNNSRQVQHGYGYCYDGNGNGIDDCAEQDDYPPELIGNAYAGYGLAQWSYPSRCRELVSFARNAASHSGSAEVQVSFFCIEFADSRSRFERIDDLDAATRWFHDVYERSADGESGMQLRVGAAERIYAALTHSGAGYVAAAKAIADDDSHGYSMARRTRNPDVDCSSLVYYSLLDAGWTTNDLGSYPFTTFNMGPILESVGFEHLPFTGMGDLIEGDILVNPSRHTEIYFGNGQCIGAHNDYDGRPGDSSGREVSVSSFWNAGYEDVYRRAA